MGGEKRIMKANKNLNLCLGLETDTLLHTIEIDSPDDYEQALLLLPELREPASLYHHLCGPQFDIKETPASNSFPFDD